MFGIFVEYGGGTVAGSGGGEKGIFMENAGHLVQDRSDNALREWDR